MEPTLSHSTKPSVRECIRSWGTLWIRFLLTFQ
nr:MAG TPA: hypothetical protein [Caudoviricetes sp.]